MSGKPAGVHMQRTSKRSSTLNGRPTGAAYASRLSPPRRTGFTLIELLVTMTVIALLLTLVTPRYLGAVSRAEETTLKTNLAVLRDAIDKFHADQERYPESLEQLVKLRYLRAVPLDPITKSSASWTVTPPDDPRKGAVFEVRSGSTGTGGDGTAYATW